MLIIQGAGVAVHCSCQLRYLRYQGSMLIGGRSIQLPISSNGLGVPALQLPFRRRYVKRPHLRPLLPATPLVVPAITHQQPVLAIPHARAS